MLPGVDFILKRCPLMAASHNTRLVRSRGKIYVSFCLPMVKGSLCGTLGSLHFGAVHTCVLSCTVASHTLEPLGENARMGEQAYRPLIPQVALVSRGFISELRSKVALGGA